MRIGIDIGGTFTDFVLFDPQDNTLRTSKILSTPTDPSRALLDGVKGQDIDHIIHGSTVATNALLEGKGAKTALITTEGFKDILEIGRQDRPSLYDFSANPPTPLVPSELRLEIKERINANGEVQTKLDTQAIPALIQTLKQANITSVAVSLLFSFLHPEHERIIEEQLTQAGFLVSTSSRILPEFREYERTSTTVVNAYVSPIMDAYLVNLEDNLESVPLQIMQSNGGAISPAEARQNAVRCILSGPAGGVVGAQAVAQQAGFSKIIGFDMGGTSTDVSLVDGDIQVTTEAAIGGYPIHIPLIDIHTVGSGGGSIAHIDKGGALRVGPQSAGADPGPACYGKGSLPTVTDANLILNRLQAEHFLGGEMKLEENASRQAIQSIANQLNLTLEETALGIIHIANAHMERALRVISIERGYDPRDFSLVSFGGAGGLHAADLARGLHIPTALIPPQASTLSAYGMLMADVVKDYSQTVMLSGDTPTEELKARFTPLEKSGQTELQEEGIQSSNISLLPSLDIRYKGQSFELNIPFEPNFIESFHQSHQELYGYAIPDGQIQIVNLRLKAVGAVESPNIQPSPTQSLDPAAAILFERDIYFSTNPTNTICYDWEQLQPGNHIPGPAVIIRPDTTIIIGEQDQAQVDGYQNLIVTIRNTK